MIELVETKTNRAILTVGRTGCVSMALVDVTKDGRERTAGRTCCDFRYF